MAETNRTRPAAAVMRFLAKAVVLGAVVAGMILTQDLWLQPLERLFGVASVEEAESAEEHDHAHDPDVLMVSEQARKSLGIDEFHKVRRYPVYERTIRVPGRVVEIPGVSLREVTASLSGVVTKIHIQQGQETQPGAPLFDVSPIHETAVQLQLDLLDALGRHEVKTLEIQRLQDLNRDRSDLIARSRILQQQYERRQLNHTIESRKQALLLLGFSAEQIRQLVREHEHHPPAEVAQQEENDEEFEHPLIETIRISVPEQPSDASRERYLVTELPVHEGEHVEAGQILCRLADYRSLYLEGRAFEHQQKDITRAIRNNGPVAAVLNPGAGEPEIRRDLQILFQDPKIDEKSRTTRFYVPIANQRSNGPLRGETAFVDWELRPGQLIEVLVPVERLEEKLVVPAEAVVEHGLDHYVFQASGDSFIRRPVVVEYRDRWGAVLGTGSRIYEGDAIAAGGAYQLQLALVNRAAGPADPQAGHGHPH